MGRIDPLEFEGRRRFPEPAKALERARLLFSRLPVPPELEEYIRDPSCPIRAGDWTPNAVIHGDLHAGNFVWRPGGSLAAIIDFERFWIGNQLIEISALMTGTCFSGGALDVGRFGRMLKATSGHLRESVISPDMLLDTLITVALYFFGRVNRSLLCQTDGTAISKVEWRDAERARELALRRGPLKKVIKDILI